MNINVHLRTYLKCIHAIIALYRELTTLIFYGTGLAKGYNVEKVKPLSEKYFNTLGNVNSKRSKAFKLS